MPPPDEHRFRTPRPTTAPERLLADLDDLCDQAALAPGSDRERLAALEPRADRPASARPPTAAVVAQALVRRLRHLPAVEAAVAAELHRGDEGAAGRELRAAHGLLDELGCPRGGDDRPWPLLERLRWLVQAVAGGMRPLVPDPTPVTGAQQILPPPDPLPGG